MAYRLLIAASYGLEDARSRDFLINALALEHTPAGRSLTDRRRRYMTALDESRVRDHEDEALEEVARWLLVMEHPEVLFGRYTAGAFVTPPAEWDVGIIDVAVDVDLIHPREELAWDFLEETTVLDEHGLAVATESRGLARALIDGVTGYTLHHTTNTGSRPVGIHVVRGGKPGKRHPLGATGTYALNIDFLEPVPKNQLIALHWILELEPSSDAKPVLGSAHAAQVATRDLTLRVQFQPIDYPSPPATTSLTQN